MTTCTSCGHDVTGKKFCPDCGTPVQVPQVEAATANCPRCNGTIKASAAFCMHCGTSLGAQSLVAAAPQPTTRQCAACYAEIPVGSAFCTSCGQSVQSVPVAVSAAPSQIFCTNCGTHNNPGVHFCAGCGQAVGPTTGPQTGGYQQPSSPYGQPQPYTQQPSQYAAQPYAQQPAPSYGQQQYNPNYPQQQPGSYQQPDPMLGQQALTLRCPVCMAMAPVGTPACPSCHTNLAGVVPTPAAAAMQGQQQGGIGGMLQGNAGKYAMGALGGAAAVIGGEMLLHGVENDLQGGSGGGYGYEHHRHHHREEGLLGGLGNLGNDIGLF